MDAPQLQQQVIPPQPLRLPDMKLMAGPREIEFEIELPKGGQWNLEGENDLVMTSSAPEVVAPGRADFQHLSMRFMVPVTALRSGETVLTYDLKVAWTDKNGICTDQRQIVQRVSVETGRGATVPWVHYKVQPNGAGSDVVTSGG